MVEAGEAGGFLDVVLAQIADFQSREKELKSKVLTAMIYPCILFCPGAGGVDGAAGVFHSEIPEGVRQRSRFAAVDHPNHHRRQPCRALLRIVRRGGPGGHRRFWCAPGSPLKKAGASGKEWFCDRRWSARWSRNLPWRGSAGCSGTLLGAGVPLVQGLNVARKSIGNQILVDAVRQSIERVQQGGRLGQSLADCKDSVLRLRAGNDFRGGGKRQARRANWCASPASPKADLDRNLKTAVAFAEPLMLFLIAAFIGTIFIGMLLPVFSLQEYIK